MPDYQQSKIYKLWSPSQNLVYYGSTTQPLSIRLGGHIAHQKNIKYKHHTKAHLVLDCEDYKIELVEECPCNNKQQLVAKEKEYIINNECVNKALKGCAPRTKEYLKNYYENRGGKEQKKEYYQKWCEKNKYKNIYTDEDADKIIKLEKELKELKKQATENYKKFKKL